MRKSTNREARVLSWLCLRALKDPPPTSSRSKTEMNNLVSVVLQSSVDKGKWPEG